MFKILPILLLLSLSISSTNQQNVNNIVFDLADLTVDYETNDGTIHLEAFKSTFNDLIIKNKLVENYGQLNWVSIGYPKLVLNKISSNLSSSFISFKTEGFVLTVEMLTNSQRNLFKDIVKRKYNIDIRMDQIVSLIPAKFECQMKFYQDDTKILINGQVIQLTRFPLKLLFSAPLNSNERILFEKRLAKNDNQLDIDIDCEVNSQGTVSRSNTLIITSSQLNQFGLLDDIFGLGSEVFVSRNQISSISSELYQKLNVIEDYQMPETQFKESFVDDFIKQTALSAFQYVGIDQVLAQFSKYDFTEDLKPSVIKSELSRLLTIKKVSNKELLQLNQTQYERLINQYGQSTGGSAGVSIFGIGFGGTASYASSRLSDWEKSNTSFSNQLKELNTYDKNEVEWSRSGNIIIPKSIKVSKLVKSLFNKNLVFSRVKVIYYDAPFKRLFSLDSNQQLLPAESLIQLWDKLNNLETKLDQNINQTQLISNQINQTNQEISNQINQTNQEISNQINQINLKINNITNKIPELSNLIDQTNLKISKIIANEIGCQNPIKYGFTQRSGTYKYYAIADLKMTWFDAEAYCQSLNAHLPIPKNMDDINFLRGYFASRTMLVRNYITDGYWLGGYRSSKTGQYKWIDNSTFSFTNWSPDQPDRNGLSNFVYDYLYRNEWQGWIDVDSGFDWTICELSC